MVSRTAKEGRHGREVPRDGHLPLPREGRQGARLHGAAGAPLAGAAPPGTRHRRALAHLPRRRRTRAAHVLGDLRLGLRGGRRQGARAPRDRRHLGADGSAVPEPRRAPEHGAPPRRARPLRVVKRARDGLAELEAQDAVFAALAHASRRHILVVLQARGGRVKAGEIASRFACSWPTTTRHLRVLEDAGLVRVTQRGRERIYTVDRERLERIAGRWLALLLPAPATPSA